MASAFVADFARMPTQRKVMVFVVIGALLGLVYWKFAYKALDEDLDAAQVEHDNKVSTNRRLAADIPAYEELRAHMTRLKELIEKNQTALPSAPELPAFFETLQHKVAESGVEIRKWSNRPEEPVESFIKVPVEIEISGTFMQIKRFFASLIQRDVSPTPGDDHASPEPERIVSIENLALTNPEVKNREIALSAKFTAVTFRQEEKPAPGTPVGGPPGTARPVAPAPVAPPPPLPSPATPAGAKARVENALEKGDARDRKAAGAADAATGAAPAAPLPTGAAPAAAPPAARPGPGSDRLKGGL
ncbi:MAG TPA: type 4a pilus biogenesis protein PilO [Kofleriaceae bacterium]|jgi:Tfp pilus assembly protein PilO|nr:type 4a pilus biogenesis protein PilO [Kofleriaceae bacterium]